MAALHAFGNGEVELVDTVDSIRPRVSAVVGSGVCALWTLIITVEVLVSVRWTTALYAVDDKPVLRVLDLSWICLVGNADLTRATAMHSIVRSIASIEGEKLRRSSGHVFATRRWQIDSMAREIATRGIQGILRSRAGDWLWGGDEQVRIRCQSERGSCQSCCIREHGWHDLYGVAERVCAKRC